MPYARPKSKRTSRPRRRPSGVRKRTYKKRTVFRPQRLLRVGFPKTNMVKLRYATGISLNPGATTLATYAFRANSLYDPDYSGIGHQPMNFDMWSQLYNHYTVVGAKITCTVHSETTSQGGGLISGINLADDIAFTTDPETMIEQGLTKYRLSNISETAGAGRGIRLTKGFSCKKFFNITNPTDNTARIGANVLADPTELAYFVVFIGPTPASGIDIAAHYLTISIDYIAIFSEPKEQVQS